MVGAVCLPESPLAAERNNLECACSASLPPPYTGGLLVWRLSLNHHFSKWGGHAPPFWRKYGGGEVFEILDDLKWDDILGSFSSLAGYKITKIFFARTFGARDQLYIVFAGDARQKALVCEPTHMVEFSVRVQIPYLILLISIKSFIILKSLLSRYVDEFAT